MKPSDLVRTIAEAFERTEMSLLPLDRAAVAAGLRASGARGVNAPRMGTKDAAALVLMVLTHTGGVSPETTAARVKDAWKATGSTTSSTWRTAVDDVGTKKMGKTRKFIESIECTFSNFTEAKDNSSSLGECLTSLILDYIDGQMQTFFEEDDDSGCKNINLKIQIPMSTTSIEFVKTDNTGNVLTVSYEFSNRTKLNTNGKITTTQEMSFLPLLHIAKAFRDDFYRRTCNS